MKTVNLSLREAALAALSCSIVLAFVTIAASQIFLGIALLLFLLLREKPKWPAGMAWAGAFLGLTLVAALASGEPASALPQIRKLYLWTLLPLGASLFVGGASRAPLVGGVLFASATSALWGLWEFREKWIAAAAAGQDFYLAYVAARITGFMSHWMTFGAHMMIGFALVGALLLFARRKNSERAALAALALIFVVAMLIGWTRSVWLGAALIAVTLISMWRPIFLAALPVALVALYFVSPAPIKSRVDSIFQPKGQVDSNLHREITREVGLRMIAAHPLLGLGPEGPGKHFREYLPERWKTQQLPEGFYGHLHNVYLQYGAERGLPALACFLMFVGLNMREWWRKPTAIRRFAFAAMIGLAAEGFFEHNIGDSEVLTLFLALFGIGAAPEPQA